MADAKKTAAERAAEMDAADRAAAAARDEARAFSAEQMRAERIATGDAIPDVGGGVQVFEPFTAIWHKADADQAREHRAGLDPKVRDGGEGGDGG
jgi:hypothetical protein